VLYDVFISHASEDKDEIVRPLAEALGRERLAVWFDEFSLNTGASLRRSIDVGLAKSRYGIVVLSPHFFGKSWPEWELDGLVQRHLAGSDNIILPIWHRVGKAEVAANSPSLADIIAIPSSLGLDEIVRRILAVIQPEGSALVTARNFIMDRGYEPPVISDDWWLDVIEASKWQDEARWNFPIWRMTEDSPVRGQNLAWIVMQHLWQEEAEAREITQITPPNEVAHFILTQPGLREISERMPDVLVELAPQLAIPGFAGPLEPSIQSSYEMSSRDYEIRRSKADRSGSGLTVNGLCPLCDEEFALRHPTFGDYDPALVACGFVQGHAVFGPSPNVRAYEIIDYLVWFLSANSNWLPQATHAFLLRGMKEWAAWPWGLTCSDYESPARGGLMDWLPEPGRMGRSTLTEAAKTDLRDRIRHSRATLLLPETTSELVERFISTAVIESWFDAQNRRQKRRDSTKPKR
jgi:TIR domain-containing protein